MLLHSEQGMYSCTLDPSVKRAWWRLLRFGKRLCFIPLWSGNNFKVHTFLTLVFTSSTADPFHSSSQASGAAAGPVLLGCPWSTTALHRGVRGALPQESPLQPLACWDLAVPPFVSCVLVMVMSSSMCRVRQGHKRLKDQREAGGHLHCQSWKLMRWCVLKAVCLAAGCDSSLTSGLLCRFQEHFLLFSVYTVSAVFLNKPGSNFTPIANEEGGASTEKQEDCK